MYDLVIMKQLINYFNIKNGLLVNFMNYFGLSNNHPYLASSLGCLSTQPKVSRSVDLSRLFPLAFCAVLAGYIWCWQRYKVTRIPTDIPRVDGDPALLESQINKPNAMGKTPLWEACERGELDRAIQLLDSGANLAIRNGNGVTPLWIAAQNGKIAVVEELLKRGADVSIPHHNGITPLWIACQEGHEEVVRQLLERGADPNTQGFHGCSPLWAACQAGCEKIVTLLLEKGGIPIWQIDRAQILSQ